jgi:hypothetical protein
LGFFSWPPPVAKSAAKARANRLKPIIVCGDPPM